MRGIEDTLRAADYKLLLGNSDDDLAQEQLYMSTLRAEGIAGIVFFPVINKSLTVKHQRAMQQQVPLVAIDRAPIGLDVDTVKVTNIEGARAAVAHLTGLHHKRIALINGPAQLDVPSERRAGYEQALKAARLPIERDLIIHSDFHEAGGYAAMSELLNKRHPPSAVFVANNLMTLGALQVIYERGLRIPQDIALVCFDDMTWVRSFHPPLTAVAQPTYDIGSTAAHLLLDRLREPNRPVRHVVLQTTLMVRHSCGSLLTT